MTQRAKALYEYAAQTPEEASIYPDQEFDLIETVRVHAPAMPLPWQYPPPGHT